jgi:signal transduction histidine kinase
VSPESSRPSAALSPLARARFDELLQELLLRVGDVIDAQERLRGLLDAVVVIARDLTLDRVLDRIVRAASQLADAEYAALGVLGSGRERRLQEFITFGLSDDQRAAIGDLPRGKGLLGHIIDHPEPLRLADIHAHPESYGFPSHHPPMTSFLGVPIRIRDKVFGNLYLTEKRGGGNFTDEDEEIVVALAAAAGVVIENARLYEEGARREAWLGASVEITSALLGRATRAEALQLVADRARSVASADVAYVLLNESDSELVVRVVSGVAADGVVGIKVPRAGSLAGSVVSSGDMFVVEQSALDAGQPRDFPAPPDWPRIGPLVILPLRTASGVDGALVVGWAQDNTHVFYEVDLELPAAFAEQAALALEVTKAQEDQALLAVFEDRDRIGRDLHDLVIQRLFAIGLGLENTMRLAGRPEVSDRISAAVDDLDATIKDIRRSIFSLSVPTDAADLRKELEDILAAAAEGLRFQPVLRTSGPVDSSVSAAIRPHLVAVVTEAVSNAARHAHAEVLVVTVSVGDEIGVVVTDDGTGFDPTALDRESGLGNLRYRAESLGGTCVVTSARGHGTTVAWTVPVGRD